MKTITCLVIDPLGFHARPVSMMAKKAKECEDAFGTTIMITYGETTVKAKSIMKVMSLGVRCNDTVIFKVDGGDENATIETFKPILIDYFPLKVLQEQ